MTDPNATTDAIRILGAVGSDELPEDLAAYTKATARRKVNRLLERISRAPFAAATMLWERCPVGSPDRVALVTVSGWDPDTIEPDLTLSAAERSDFFQHPTGVGDYLQRMPNNAICQISIAGGFRGPNVHYTGGVDSLAMVLTLAAGHLTDGSADSAMIVAYDIADGDPTALPDRSDAVAAALMLAPGDRTDGLGHLAQLRPALEELPRSTPAVAAIDSWLAGVRPTAVVS